MTLKQLEAFYWAATCSSFAIAAQRLHLSLSTLSKRIAELEDSLGQALFDRSGHKAALTDAGNRLVPRAHALLRAADELRIEIGTVAGLHGKCRFGVGELTALTWLPRLVRMIAEAHPGLDLETHVSIGEALEKRVEDGEFDFAVVAGKSTRGTIASHAIAQAKFVWCMSAQATGRSAPIRPETLGERSLVTLPSGSGVTRLLDEWMDGRGSLPERRIVCNHWGAVAGMLVEGIGVGILPQSWAQSLAKRGALRVLRSDPPLLPLAYSFQWRRDDSRPLIGAMRELTLQAADFQSASRIL
jgi:DNA-binding transcriptional LysR family regulator